MSFFNRYPVTVSICAPNNADCREQLTYTCDLQTLLNDPAVLKGYIAEVAQKLEDRLAAEGAVTDGPVTVKPQEGDSEWIKSQQAAAADIQNVS